MRIREKEAKKRQQAGGQEGTYRRKAAPVKRYAGDLLAPVSVTLGGVRCAYRCRHLPSQPCLFAPLPPPLLQSYLQSLRDRQMGTGTSLSSMATSNHTTTIDLDYDSGSTAPLTATTPVVRV